VDHDDRIGLAQAFDVGKSRFARACLAVLIGQHIGDHITRKRLRGDTCCARFERS
jgi:hypothetical protein